MATKTQHDFVDVVESQLSKDGEKKKTKKAGMGELFAKTVAMQALKKSCRATKEMLQKEKDQIFTIQVDLGVSLMTGDPLRHPIKTLPNAFE